MTNELTPKTRFEYFLNKIADAAETPDLPVPDAGGADVGKVPTVQEDGGYALETISAQHGKFIVTFSGETSREENTATCDRTYAEIKDAYDNGYYIECRYRYGNVVPMVSANEGLFRFACDWHLNYGDEPTVCGISATIYNDGEVTVYVEGEA